MPLLPSTIEYPLEVMDEIRALACDEVLPLSHGGREVGGVLFGVRREESVRILTWRPIACAHSDGDCLHLSPGDSLALAVQMEKARVDPNLRDLRPVGCFISHSQGGVSLSRADLEIYNGFFPESWQIALVLQPAGGRTIRAGFFQRERDGSVRTDASYREFDLEPLHATPVAGIAATFPASPPVVREGVAVPEPPSFELSEAAPSHERWLWGVPVLLAAVLIGLALYHWRASPPSAPSPLATANQASAVHPDQDVKPGAPEAPAPVTETAAPATPPADPAETTQLRAERDRLAAQVREQAEELRKEHARADQLQNLVRILENRLNISNRAADK